MSEALQEVRTLEVVEMEIRVIQDQGQRVLLSMAIETGRRLEEAKAMVGHGNWGGWLKKMGYSQSSANNLMRVFREYGASQQSLFGGEANSQALGNLSLTKAIQLLALPDQESREAFVEAYDVESMSTRELEKALKERAEALADAEEARAEAKTAGEARARMETDIRMLKASLQEKDKAARELVMTKNALKGERKESETLRADIRRLKDELKELADRPVEVAVETREPTAEELRNLTEQAVEEARARDRERIEEMEKQLASADGGTDAFRALFNAWQQNYDGMMGYLERIGGRDPEKAGRMRKAVSAALERMAAR